MDIVFVILAIVVLSLWLALRNARKEELPGPHHDLHETTETTHAAHMDLAPAAPLSAEPPPAPAAELEPNEVLEPPSTDPITPSPTEAIIANAPTDPSQPGAAVVAIGASEPFKPAGDEPAADSADWPVELSSGEETGPADDLVIIEGIGPKISQVLRDAGIVTYRQLAEVDETHLKEILLQADLRLANPGSWKEQARLAANGEWEELEALKKRLTAGR